MTVGERVRDHLAGLKLAELTDRDVWPEEATQDGVARVVGISRSHASLELRRLAQHGQVRSFRAHVPGGKVRRLVYRVEEVPPVRVVVGNGSGYYVNDAKAHDALVVDVRCPRCSAPIHAVLEKEAVA